MQQDSLEPARVFRTAAWIWLGYLISLALIDLFIYAERPMQPVIRYHLINGIPSLVFIGLSYSRWLKTNSRLHVPVMIILISASPIVLSHVLDLRLPEAPLANLEGMVFRQLPVLFIGSILVAWHYRLPTILLYSAVIYSLEMLIVSAMITRGDRQTVLFFVITIRTIALIVVSIFIHQLINRLRFQQKALELANNRLARHASTLEKLTISRERNRLARELHDTLAHTLSGLSVQLETVRAYWDVEPETARKLLDQSLAATRTGLDETRRALKALRASPLDDLGLWLALRTLAETAAERGRLKLELALPPQTQTIAPEAEQCIYRVAQEALENVLHHANARHLIVQLEVQDKQISLVIEDDGQGLDLEQPTRADHYGLAGMRERAELAGGEIRIESRPGKGTRVQLVIKGMSGYESDHL